MDTPAPKSKSYISWTRVFSIVSGVTLILLLISTIDIFQHRLLLRAQMMGSLDNARRISIAIHYMVSDLDVSQDPRLGWPGDIATSNVDPVTDLSSFAKRLVTLDYVQRADLGRIFGAPGVPTYSEKGLFSGENSAFKIYLVTRTDDEKAVLLATRNFTFGQGLDASARPFGDNGFVFVRKGGDAVISTSKREALDKKLLGYMPGHHTPENPGEETDENVWKK